jgi:hypothetical protein
VNFVFSASFFVTSTVSRWLFFVFGSVYVTSTFVCVDGSEKSG